MSVPKLRFKGFDGDWTKVSLDKVSKVFDGTHQTPNYVESGIKFVSVENIHAPYDSDKFITVEAFKKDFKNLPQLNDILMTRITAGEIGATAIVDDREPLAYYVSLALIRPKAVVTTPFLNQYIGTPFFKNELHKRIIHVAFPKKINLGDINECLVSLPDKQEEQTKIASFLSSVDEKISQLTQKYELLSQYKQGMMQKLFSQQIRFKADDGSEFGEWEVTTLGEIIKFVNGKGHENDVDESGNFTLINSKFISTDGIVSKNVNKCHQKVINDCLVMVMSDIPNGKALAKVLHIRDGSKFALNQRIGMFIFSKENYPKFFQYQLNRHKYYLSFDSGVGQTNLKKEDVLGCPTFIPCLEEQTKIANFLSAIDQKIEVLAQQIEQAKQWKKGLLQQMFV